MSPPKNEEIFANFAKFGDPVLDGKTITLTNVDKWLVHAKLLDGRDLTRTDTGVCFNKFKQRTLNYQEFLRFLDDLCATKNLDPQEIKTTLFTCPLPGSDPPPDKGKGPKGPH